jgi:hypothetical protein
MAVWKESGSPRSVTTQSLQEARDSECRNYSRQLESASWKSVGGATGKPQRAA